MSVFEDFLNSPEKLSSFIGAAAAISIPLIVNIAKDIWFDVRKRKTEKNYIVVQLIYLLDEFVANCAEVSWDMGYDPYYPEPDYNEYEAQTNNPTFDLSSVKGDQKYLEPLMLYRLQGINIEIAKSKDRLREITNSPNFGQEDVDYYFECRRQEYAAIGLEAADIANKLRVKYKVPQRDDWNSKDSILRSVKQINRKKAILQLQKMERKARRVMYNHIKDKV